MINFGFKLGSKYALEFCAFRHIRKFWDGISFVELNCGLDLYDGDHKPSFRISLVLLNWTVAEFEIYNQHHLDTIKPGDKK